MGRSSGTPTSPSPWSREAAERIEVFATGDTVVVDPTDALGEGVRRIGYAAREGYEHARAFHARAGPRPGLQPVASWATEVAIRDVILQPVLCDPNRACDLARSGALFRPTDELRVDVAGIGSRYLVWEARLRCSRHDEPVVLHLRASPSMVVTLLELVPQHRLGRHRRGFIRAGTVSLQRLADRLSAGAGAA